MPNQNKIIFVIIKCHIQIETIVSDLLKLGNLILFNEIRYYSVISYYKFLYVSMTPPLC